MLAATIFGSVLLAGQLVVLCDSPTSCHYTTEEIGGVATVRIMESLPDRAYGSHTIFRGEPATVYATLRVWRADDFRNRGGEEAPRWAAKLNAAISVRPAPIQPDPSRSFSRPS